MADFFWKDRVESGACIACMSFENERGFVDFIGDVIVRDQLSEGIGKVDVVICANCLETAARLIGSSSKDQAEEWGYREAELTMEIDKLKDEVLAWQQRFVSATNLGEETLKELTKVAYPQPVTQSIT